MKVVIALLGRNVEKTLEKTYFEIPLKYRKNVFLADDSSSDSTLNVAKKLKIKVYPNPRSNGYGSNAKNCFDASIKEGGDIVVILHADNQYDPSRIPALVKPLEDGKADFVTGTRMIHYDVSSMPLIRYYGNRGLTMIENIALGTKLSDLHCGLVAVKTDILKKIPYELNYDDYTFHSELIFQINLARGILDEVPIPTRYEAGSQSTNPFRTVVYGLRTLKIVGIYFLHKLNLKKSRSFLVDRV